MTNHPNRNRGASGYVPTTAEIRLARGTMLQTEAASLIYTTGVRWSDYESGKSRMHPAAWELFNIKRGEKNGQTSSTEST